MVELPVWAKSSHVSAGSYRLFSAALEKPALIKTMHLRRYFAFWIVFRMKKVDIFTTV